MKRLICSGAAICVLLVLSPAPSHTQRFSTNVSTNVRDGGPVTSCDQLEVRFEDAQTVRAEEKRSLARSAVRALTVEGSRNGGIYVHGWDRDEYDVTLCKAAASWAYGGVLSDISLSIANGRISVTGPASDGWIAYLLVAMPRGGSIDLTTHNGPVGLSDVSGSIGAHSTNGPIGLKNCSGTIQADAQNGPIHLAGGAGSIRVRTQNGPIGVELTGSSWSGEGLEARATNGPLSLRVPPDYQSGVEVETSNHSPFKCRGAVCGQAQKDWDDRSRIMRFGGSKTAVRLSTVNGPVSINSDR